MESDPQSGCTFYDENFKHGESEILSNIRNHDCFMMTRTS